MMGVGGLNEKTDEFRRVLEKVYRERGFDFRGYRESTLSRRVGRRLRARCVSTYTDYARVLDEDSGEYDNLLDDLTINVSSFFRDEVAFKALAQIVVPELLHGDAERHTGIRVWSAGCARGQEAYSIAMILLEKLGPQLNSDEAIIFGTDIDAKTLQRAREGIFGQRDMEGIRATWEEKYFLPPNGGFRVKPALSQMVTFEEHSLVGDPPYYGLDLIVCRSVLIYFTPELQTRVFRQFHEALKPGGYLLLGKSELPTGETKKLFRCVNSKAKLYRKARRPAEAESSSSGKPLEQVPEELAR